MKGLFHSSSVVVIGVSTRRTNLGKEIANNLFEFGYGGLVRFVGPQGGSLFGHRIHNSLDEITDKLDLAVILTPAATVPDFVEQCGRRGIRRIIIESGGFGEFGGEGRKLSDQLKSIAAKYDIRFLGPNCVGTMNCANGLATIFTPLKNVFRAGGIGIIAQSGGVALSLLNMFQGEQLGTSKFASIGNKLDIDENEMMEYFIEDPETNIICMYLESIKNGRRLTELARSSPKPIVVHKANISSMSRVIAQSHTDSLANDDQVVDAALAQAGMMRFREMNSYLDFVKVLQIPRMEGRNLGIVSRSGGHAVMAADAAYLQGFHLPPFSEEFLDEIRKRVRADVIRLGNPLDLGDLFDFDFYIRIIETMLAQANMDGILFVHTYFPGYEGEPSRRLLLSLAELSRKYSKPVALCVYTSPSELARLHREMEYPIFVSPERAVAALDVAIRYHERKLFLATNNLIVHPDPLPDALNIEERIGKAVQERRNLLLNEALDIVRALGLNVPNFAVANDSEQFGAKFPDFPGPYALKVIGEGISHKSDVGGVVLDVLDWNALKKSAVEMTRRLESSSGAQLRGFMVQEMVGRVPGDVELIIGGKRDPHFGPVVLLGHGGTLVEVLARTSLRTAPLAPAEIDEMIEELPGSEILSGVRGLPAVDKEALKDAIARVAHLMVNFPQIESIDINPLLVSSSGARALDARIFLKD
ncbi:MAG TPA: acetate--CoA ligase family protein [Desulfomonilaceae bacterium]|nr:acetate--CoA ligase family protein [Desulfomonilaceae bacterium]